MRTAPWLCALSVSQRPGRAFRLDPVRERDLPPENCASWSESPQPSHLSSEFSEGQRVKVLHGRRLTGSDCGRNIPRSIRRHKATATSVARYSDQKSCFFHSKDCRASNSCSSPRWGNPRCGQLPLADARPVVENNVDLFRHRYPSSALCLPSVRCGMRSAYLRCR